jgi:serine protease Do
MAAHHRSNLPWTSRRIALLAGAGIVALGLALPVAAQRTGGTGATAVPAQFVPGPGGRAPLSFADIVDGVKGSVVSIQVTGGTRTAQAQQTPPQQQPPRGQQPRRPDDFKGIPGLPDDHPLNEFFRNMPRNTPGMPNAPTLSQGSGFVISEDGYVVTNNHVIENANKIQVTFDNREKFEADLVGTDSRTDIALLKIKADRKFAFVKFAAKDPRVGDWVVAVGNPFGFGGTVTAGIVSALARDVNSGPYDFLQIDAAVNRGNSGGPTFNLDGEVIGVNTAIYSPSGGSVGIAFAVPARTVTEVVAQLRSSGSVSRGWLGVKIQTIDEDTAASLGLPDAKGALVNEVTANGPAAAAGLRNGDAILSINGDRIADSRELARKIAGFTPDTTIDVRVLRGGKEELVKVKLGDFKDASGPQPTPARAEPPKPAPAISLSQLGLSLAPASQARGAAREGVVISEVEANSDAAAKGLRAGDVILEVSSAPVTSTADVQKAVEEAQRLGRRAVLLRVKSGDVSRFVAVQMKRG